MESVTNNKLFNSQGYLELERLSWTTKKENNFEWVEKRCVGIDAIHQPWGNVSRLKRLQMNYDLAAGIGDKWITDLFGAEKQVLEEAGLVSSYQGIHHYGVIDQVLKARSGEQQKRPLSPVAVDFSRDAVNLRKKKTLELQQEYLQQNVIQKVRQTETQRYMQEYQIDDPYKLSPEDQKQMFADIEQRVEFGTPDQIHEWMSKNYKTPSETQAQHLVNWLMAELDIKFLTDQMFKHGDITDEEISRIGIRNNKPFLELVNPMGFSSLSRQNAFFIEDSINTVYKQYVFAEDLYAWHGKEIEDNKKLRDILGKRITESYGDANLDRLARWHPDLIKNADDIRTEAGQQQAMMLRNVGMYGGKVPFGAIEYTHYNFRALRKMKELTRIIEGKKEIFYLDEVYEMDKSRGDYSLDTFWAPEAWEAYKIGNDGDCQFICKQPIPGQYKSPSNPFDVKLSYYGAVISKLMGNTESRGPVDNAKMLQYEYNVYKSKIRELEATDLGKVMTYELSKMPAGYDLGKINILARYGKMIPILNSGEGNDPGNNSKPIEGVDLSNIRDMLGKLEYSREIYNKIIAAMSYNPSKMGEQSPYLTATNNQQNIVQSTNQTEDRFAYHNVVVENLLNGLVNITRVALKDNDMLKSYLMSDMSIAELDLDSDLLARSEIGIKIRNSSEDWDNLQFAKSLLQPMVINQMITASDTIRLAWAKNGADVLNIANAADEKVKALREEGRQAEAAQMQQQLQMQLQAEAEKQKFEFQKLQMTLDSKIKEAVIESQRFALQQDINHNQQSDQIEITMLKIAQQQQEFMEKMRLEWAKLNQEYNQSDKDNQIDIMDNKVKQIAAKNKSRPK